MRKIILKIIKELFDIVLENSFTILGFCIAIQLFHNNEASSGERYIIIMMSYLIDRVRAGNAND